MTTTKTSKVVPDMGLLRLPELQKRYEEVVGEATRCPNRVYLIRRITEALAARVPAVLETPAPVPQNSPNDDATVGDTQTVVVEESPPMVSPSPAAHQQLAVVNQRGRLKSMSVDELQAKYFEVVGRTTGSSNSAYLIWKIREAVKGRVPIGPRVREERSSELGEMKTLPFRIGTRQLEGLDEAWRSHGVKNRMEFFRLAVGFYLGHIGATEAAALFESTT